MTRLVKPVKRTTTLNQQHRPLEIVITLYPEDIIGLRDKGRRIEYRLPLATCYVLAAKARAAEIIAERKTKRTEKRQAR